MNGDKLKNLREKSELYQKDISKDLHISSSTIGMYEQGRREPDNNTLKKLANYFDVSTDYLLDNEKPLSKTEEELVEKEILKKVLIKYGYMNYNEDLSDNELKKLMEFAKANKKFIKEDNN